MNTFHFTDDDEHHRVPEEGTGNGVDWSRLTPLPMDIAPTEGVYRHMSRNNLETINLEERNENDYVGVVRNSADPNSLSRIIPVHKVFIKFINFLVQNKNTYKTCANIVNKFHFDTDSLQSWLNDAMLIVILEALMGNSFINGLHIAEENLILQIINESGLQKEIQIVDWLFANGLDKHYQIIKYIFLTDHEDDFDRFFIDYLKCKIIKNTTSDEVVASLPVMHRAKGFKWTSDMFIFNYLDKLSQNENIEKISVKCEFPHVACCITILKLTQLPKELVYYILETNGYPIKFIKHCDFVLQNIMKKRLNLKSL